jgi:hypothetical protein
VNESGAGTETQGGVARSVVFGGATKVESVVPRVFVGRGTVGNKCFVVVNEAIAEIEKEAPSIQSRAKLEANEAFLRCTVLPVGTREEIRDGIEVGVLRKMMIEIKAVTGDERSAVRAGFAVSLPRADADDGLCGDLQTLLRVDLSHVIHPGVCIFDV